MKLSTRGKIRMIAVKLNDIVSRRRFAKVSKTPSPLPYHIQLSQPFKPSETLENKKHNLREAASRINRAMIKPGETFSFWRVVGNPNNPKRFREGRSINAGVLSRNVGGGLCQASGIIHHAALMAGLDITERFNHSVDLYDDNSRFAPLGTDATVVYGFKDLRLINNTGATIRFKLSVDDDTLTLRLESEKPLKPEELAISAIESTDGRKHVEISRGDGTVVSSSVYQPLA